MRVFRHNRAASRSASWGTDLHRGQYPYTYATVSSGAYDRFARRTPTFEYPIQTVTRSQSAGYDTEHDRTLSLGRNL